jgi:hypothetical protein
MDDVERAFDEWRRDKRTKEIPEALWERAVRAASVHGLTTTAQRLGLNYARLKERCERDTRDTGFVELAASELPLGGESVLELENAAGFRLRLVLRGASLTAVTAVAKELWSATR